MIVQDFPKKTVITAALPYANGSIHLGHMVEYIQADIYVRAQKIMEKDVLFVCADDTHGAPIQIKAMSLSITPEELIVKVEKEHKKDFKDFGIAFDNYYTTNSPENKEFSEEFFAKLKKAGLIYTKDVKQMYDAQAQQFLPDRFIRGKCPKCGAIDQYGDVCEVCGSTYCPTDLLEPYSVLTRSKPVMRKSTHYFFKLSSLSNDLLQWIDTHHGLQEEIKNFVRNWIKAGLIDWCISRDEPYFGFEIPESEKETGAKKYFYVWLDAPIGYISATKNYCDAHGTSWEEYWKQGSICHFIGKDIVYFHLLFWPAMLKFAGYQLPSQIHVHGFLTVNKEKMSKSRGTFITARQYLDCLPAELLRFYYATHLGLHVEDLDFDLAQFKEKVNNELIGNLANFCNRTLSFIKKNFDGVVIDIDASLVNAEIDELEKHFAFITAAYEHVNLKDAVKCILEISSFGNKYFQENEPWKLIKENKDATHHIVSFCAAIIQNLSILVQPIMPQFSLALQQQLGIPELKWKDLGFATDDIIVGNVQPLITKLEDEHRKLLVHGIYRPVSHEGNNDPSFPLLLKVGRIISVEDHPNADKLFIEKIDFGSEVRTVVSGIKKWFAIKELVGKHVIVVVNMKHAKFRGVKSEGMLLVAEHDDTLVLIEAPESDVGTVVTINPSIQAVPVVSFDHVEKIPFVVKGHKIFVNDCVLKAGNKEIIIHAPDGARIC